MSPRAGSALCETGDAKYSKERLPKAGAFWASPWAYDGKVFAIDETGTTHVIKAGNSFEVLGTNTLGKDMFWSTPAVSGGLSAKLNSLLALSNQIAETEAELAKLVAKFESLKASL